MEEAETGTDWENRFDNESSEEDETDEESNTTPTKLTTEDKEDTHPEGAKIARLIEEAVIPLREAIDTLTEVYLEEPQWCTDLSTLVNELIKSIPGESSHKQGANATSDDKYNISSLQFQAAMLQPCNGQVLPAAVRGEIDRLYGVEKSYAIAIRAQRAITLIVEHDPVMLKLPADPDERLLLLEVVNEWYTREYPERKPLALKQLPL